MIPIRTVKEAINQCAIRKIWQPTLKAYLWAADGCGDNLYRTASLALEAYNGRQS